jgi:hypothetical protein
MIENGRMINSVLTGDAIAIPAAPLENGDKKN